MNAHFNPGVYDIFNEKELGVLNGIPSPHFAALASPQRVATNRVETEPREEPAPSAGRMTSMRPRFLFSLTPYQTILWLQFIIHWLLIR
jgi:hypothetical protein